MKSFLARCIVFLFSAWPALMAAESFRTDINPALIYWQAVTEWPVLPEADHDHIFTNEWRGRQLDERFGKLMTGFDNSFKLIRRAAKSKIKCDWGYDLSDGPQALLPGLAKAKAAAQMARHRARWHLQQGDQDAARDELLSAFVLGRNLSTDGVLISALVQYAIENIVVWAIAENFHQFTPETLRQIAAGLDAAPARGTIAQCIPIERYSFSGWLLRKMEEFKTRATSDEQVIALMRDVMQTTFGSGDKPDPTLAGRIITAAGGTTAGLARYIGELSALYDEAAVLMNLPHDQFVPAMKTFHDKIENHPNLLVSIFFPVFENCRNKEFAAEITVAMLKVGIEHRLSSDGALKLAKDPVTGASFGFRRFVFQGMDRGFELSSKFAGRGFEERLILLEKEGAPVQVIGKNAGLSPR